jgi:hypothetical protein
MRTLRYRDTFAGENAGTEAAGGDAVSAAMLCARCNAVARAYGGFK